MLAASALATLTALLFAYPLSPPRFPPDSPHPSQSAASTAGNLPALESHIRRALHQHILGRAAFTLIHASGAYWTKGFGMSPHTPVAIGRLSSGITSIVALRLVESQNLRLHTALRELAPEVADDNSWAQTHPIQLRHLLEHSTGWTAARSIAAGTDSSPSTREHWLRTRQARRARWQPGTYASFSEHNPSVLGYIMEQVTGMRFRALLRRELFEPLRFSRETQEANNPSPQYPDWMQPALGLRVSIIDLGIVVTLMLREGFLFGKSYLSSDSIARLADAETPHDRLPGVHLGYGMGHYSLSLPGAHYLGQTSQTPDGSIMYAYRQDAPVGFVVVSNSPHGAAILAPIIAVHLNTYAPCTTRRAHAASIPDSTHRLDASDNPNHLGSTGGAHVAGTYRKLSFQRPSYQLYYDLFSHVRVIEAGDQMEISRPGHLPTRYLPTSRNVLRQLGESHPSIALISGHTGRSELWMGPDKIYQRIYLYERLCRLLFLGFSLLGLPLTALAITRQHRRVWTVWLFPTLTALLITGTAAMAVVSHLSHQLRWLSFTLPYGTLGFTGMSAVSALQALLALNISRRDRLRAFIAALSMMVLAAYLASYGLVGTRPLLAPPHP